MRLQDGASVRRFVICYLLFAKRSELRRLPQTGPPGWERHRVLCPGILIVDGVSIGQHALMQDARNQDAAALLAVEHDVLAMLMTAQARPNVITEPAERWFAGQRLATRFQLAEVTGGLGFAPFAKGVVADVQQVSLGAARESKPSHGYRDTGRLRALRTRPKTLPAATPLASPSSIAVRSAASFASYCCSSRSKVRSPARTTSLAFS